MIIKYLRALIMLIVFPIWLVICVSVGAIFGMFIGYGKAFGSASRIWAKSLLKFSGIKLTIIGKKNVPLDKKVIFTCNHQSMTDILILLASSPASTGFMAKKSLFKIPFLGVAMKHIGCMPLERNNPKKDLKTLYKAAENMKPGFGIVVFPEGTRSKTGKIADFKRGFVTIAKKSNSLAIPTTIIGSHKTIKKGQMLLKKADVSIEFSTPYNVCDSDKTAKEIAKEVEDIVKSKLKH